MCKVQITRSGITPFQFKINTEEIDLNNNVDEINFGKTIDIEGEVIDGGKMINVKAVIKCKKTFVCDRCLTPSSEDQKINFDEEIEHESIEDDVIDLTEMIRDTLIAAQPIQNLCKEDCKGLCPVCGVNLNNGSCNCDRFVVDPRLEVLKNFLQETNKNATNS